MRTLKIIVLLCLISPLNLLLAQNIGINTTGAIPDASSLLDITSTDKGVLIPRVDIINLATAAPITTPATALLVYNTNATTGVGFYFWNGTEWIKLTDSSGNADEDWYKVGTTEDPESISDSIYTLGNVGIGTNNPTHNLHVSGGTGSGVIMIEADTDANADLDQAYVLMEQEGGSVQAHVGFGGTEGNGDHFRIGIKSTIDPDVDYSNFIIDGANNRIGVLTSSPTANFSVNGSANKIGTDTWTIISDKNFKKSISNYNEGLDLILKVKTHNFQYNQDLWDLFGENESIKNETYQGVIAQELEKIAPDMVKHINVDYIDSEGKNQIREVLNVETNKFTYALINATQEQQILIEAQAKTIKRLEERLKAIEESLKK